MITYLGYKDSQKKKEKKILRVSLPFTSEGYDMKSIKN